MESSYSERRAEQERLAAERASDERARRCHEELAKLHSERTGADPSAVDSQNGSSPLVIIEQQPPA